MVVQLKGNLFIAKKWPVWEKYKSIGTELFGKICLKQVIIYEKFFYNDKIVNEKPYIFFLLGQ